LGLYGAILISTLIIATPLVNYLVKLDLPTRLCAYTKGKNYQQFQQELQQNSRKRDFQNYFENYDLDSNGVVDSMEVKKVLELYLPID